jgi:RNA polymerase sigma-70 factor (ECF subfamily)
MMSGTSGTRVMSEPDVSAHRSRLFGLAYRMLGSPMDADDVVQEAFVRWQSVDRTLIGNPQAWLVTVTTHVALDRLRALQTERRRYVGPRIPEPIVRDVSADPAHHSEMIDDVSVTVLRMLERLTPDERAAFVLHDVFSYRHSEIAAMLGRPEAAIRQLVHRARRRLRTDKPRFAVDRKVASALVDRFMRAFEAGDQHELRALLTQNATHVSDGGGVVFAARKPVVGRVSLTFVARLAREALESVQLSAHASRGRTRLSAIDGRRRDARRHRRRDRRYGHRRPARNPCPR